MKYIIVYDAGKIESTSRNARRHLVSLGGSRVDVYGGNGDLICWAIRSGEKDRSGQDIITTGTKAYLDRCEREAKSLASMAKRLQAQREQAGA